MPSAALREQVLKDAWIGDAVLALWARKRILAENGRVDGEKYIRLTSNQFLNSLGEPSEVEARIGRVYQSEGPEAAEAWIEREILPMFEKQQAKRGRRGR
jgi:hypothetical protein